MNDQVLPRDLVAIPDEVHAGVPILHTLPESFVRQSISRGVYVATTLSAMWG